MACLLPFKAPSGEYYLNFTGQIFVMRLHLTAKRGQGQGVQFFRLLSSFPVTEKVRKKEEGKGGKKGGRKVQERKLVVGPCLRQRRALKRLNHQ